MVKKGKLLDFWLT